MAIMSGLQWYLKNVSLVSPFYSFSFFFISIPNLDQFTQQFINVIATNNDLLMDELNVIYFAPKLWLYVIIWLPRTTDNSTYFAQSLEIQGIESRLYLEYLKVTSKYCSLLYWYYPAIWSLNRHVVCNVPVSCKSKGDRNQLWAWLDSDA